MKKRTAISFRYNMLKETLSVVKCKKCNSQCYPEDRYCGKCGAKISPEFKSSYTDGFDTQEVEATQASINAAYIQFKLASVYYKKGKLDEAIAAWQKVLKFDPTNEDAKMMLEQATMGKNTAEG